jgi:ABC-2 type transport system ATP-binding protein
MSASDLRRDGGGPVTSAGPAAAVSIERLEVRRDGTPVLRDLTLTVRRGAVTGLVGPSGCGKTTLMRCIVGTQIIASGDVKVLGAPRGRRSSASVWAT